MKSAVIEKKSFSFAIRIINLYRYLSTRKNETVISKQIVRCGTSIGANVSEAERGQSKADFYSKMSIALKEANETYYWIRLLHATNYIDSKAFVSLERDITELIAILTSICKTSKTK